MVKNKLNYEKLYWWIVMVDYTVGNGLQNIEWNSWIVMVDYDTG